MKRASIIYFSLYSSIGKRKSRIMYGYYFLATCESLCNRPFCVLRLTLFHHCQLLSGFSGLHPSSACPNAKHIKQAFFLICNRSQRWKSEYYLWITYTVSMPQNAFFGSQLSYIYAYFVALICKYLYVFLSVLSIIICIPWQIRR